MTSALEQCGSISARCVNRWTSSPYHLKRWQSVCAVSQSFTAITMLANVFQVVRVSKVSIQQLLVCTNTPEINRASTPTTTRRHKCRQTPSTENSLWNWQMAVIDSETDTVRDRHWETVSLHPAIHPSFGALPCQLKQRRAHCPPCTLDTQTQSPGGQWLGVWWWLFIKHSLNLKLSLAYAIRGTVCRSFISIIWVLFYFSRA